MIPEPNITLTGWAALIVLLGAAITVFSIIRLMLLPFVASPQ